MDITQNDNRYLSKTFFWMFLGLFATGLISFYTYSSGMIESLLTKGTFQVVAIVEIIVVLLFNFLFKKLPAGVVAILYFVYAIINGISMSVIFAVFEMNSIVMVFFSAAVLFGIFALLGYKTNFDLTKFGNICLGVLLIGVIVSLVNIILGNSIINIVLDWIMLFVFFGITAYDVQKIKLMNQSGAINDDKLHIYGAMQIYLDFINIFIRLLSIFGKSKRN